MPRYFQSVLTGTEFQGDQDDYDPFQEVGMPDVDLVEEQIVIMLDSAICGSS